MNNRTFKVGDVISMENITKKQLIEIIREYMPIENNTLDWGDLCFFTKFDNFVTAFSLGIQWESNISNIPIARLKIVLFNLINFPTDDNYRKSKTSGTGYTTQRLKELNNYIKPTKLKIVELPEVK